jgi:flavin reductase (DIM6/NTAB) family NADH-FMN oxidoreductase RutF
MTIDPSVTPAQDVYKLLIGSVVPRPIAFVSSLSVDGVQNLAPFSFFTVASVDPPVLAFCPLLRGGTGTRKDTRHNVETTGEFVVNIVSESIVEAMNQTSGDYPPEVDEFAMAGLTPLQSEVVRPPRVAEALVNMECKLLQIIDLGQKALSGSLVLGQVVRFHVADPIVDNFRIDPDQLAAVARMGGLTYARTRDRFDLPRPVLK